MGSETEFGFGPHSRVSLVRLLESGWRKRPQPALDTMPRENLRGLAEVLPDLQQRFVVSAYHEASIWIDQRNRLPPVLAVDLKSSRGPCRRA